jgi:hypothetical protein
MRAVPVFLVGFLALAAAFLPACDKSGPLADLDAGSPWPTAPSVAPGAGSVTPAASASVASHDAGRIMPERPVPTSSPTVLISMPVEVQLKAIQYMASMQAPQPEDAPADPTYAKSIADRLRGVGRPDVVSSGRRIDILMEKGCDATLPKQSIARTTGASLTTLLAHGVLVVRCADHQIQCLQSTRDPDDVLCTRK